MQLPTCVDPWVRRNSSVGTRNVRLASFSSHSAIHEMRTAVVRRMLRIAERRAAVPSRDDLATRCRLGAGHNLGRFNGGYDGAVAGGTCAARGRVGAAAAFESAVDRREPAVARG